MAWLRRWRNALRRRRAERDIAREVAFHLAERADDLVAEGHDRRDAERRARVLFGNPALTREQVRDIDVARGLETLARNTRQAARALRRTPAFTVTAILTLALAIGANAAVFSVLDTVILRPLAFPDADRLVRLGQIVDGRQETPVAPSRLEDWRRLAGGFEALAGFYTEDVSETSGDLPERVRRAFVTPDFFGVWQVPPVLGRGFDNDEHRFGGPPAVVISDRYWRDRFGADPGILARTVRLGTTVYPIVGIMPGTFRFPDRHVDLWVPSQVDAPYAQSRRATWYQGIARLKVDVSIGSAAANLAAVQAQLAEQHPDTDRDVTPMVEPLKQTVVGGLGSSIWLVYGAVSVLLLIACTNIAALLLARAAERAPDAAIRRSLGASRRSIVAEWLTETSVLAGVGGAAGLLVAMALSGAWRAAGTDLPRFDEIAIDWRVLLYTLAATMAATFACGLVPALRAARGPSAAPGTSGRGLVSTGQRAQWLLVGAQVALSVTLLAGAGLLIRSVQSLSAVDRGFDTAGVLTFRISGSWGETADMPRLTQRIHDTIDLVAALPGVASAATTGWALPGVPEQWQATYRWTEARSETDPAMVAEGRSVSPEYFGTMGIPLLSGEPCRRRNPLDAAPAEVMVNRAFTDLFLGDRTSAAGLMLYNADQQQPPARIIGVVGNARETGLNREPGPTVYWCSSAPNPTPYFLARTTGDPAALVPAVRAALKARDPLRSVFDVVPLDAAIDDAFEENRLRALLLALFAATALGLASVGLYGTLSYLVAQRRREVGLRLALGAWRRTIVLHFLSQGLRIVGLAGLCGLLLSLASSRLLAGMLYGVSPSDPATLAVVIGIAAGVAAVAILIPATRAALVDPIRVLRD